MSEDVLSVRNLHTHFRTEDGVVKSVRGVDLDIGPGEVVGLVGESGSGKSVTAHSIMRLIPSSGSIVQGEILFEGEDLARASVRQMQKVRGNRIAMIFQEPMTSLNPVLRIGDQVSDVLRLHRGLSKAQALSEAKDLLGRVGIPDPKARLANFPHELSGGQRQRVMIATALACRPKLIIADEPTTALDVTIQAQILDLLIDLKRDFGCSVLLITHDLGVISETADRVAVMYAGQIAEVAEVATLFDEPLHPYTLGLMRSVPKLDEDLPEDRLLPVIGGGVPNLAELPAGCAFQTRCPHVRARCRAEEPPLREVRTAHKVRCWLYDA
ncbi:ABC transporter ATP-binding protein [Ancylobacter sonchi]|uniref:ABC transporter ATP-binding protein n=1 Tax=Ancylobacter sonchi TaxID=1937790 RepID=UPI001BD57DE0|nr:ABC transporter ATP-binding protein [Ancylobacter sonchi]MBS7535277.1 ABC transporter ATP-binding protein [Ancylobacter sonchi]